MPNAYEISLSQKDTRFFVIANTMPALTDVSIPVTNGAAISRRVFQWTEQYYDCFTEGATLPFAGCSNPLSWTEYPDIASYMYLPEESIKSIRRVGSGIPENAATDVNVFYEVYIRGRTAPVSCTRNVARPWKFQRFMAGGRKQEPQNLLVCSALIDRLQPDLITFGDPVPPYVTEGIMYNGPTFDGDFLVKASDVLAIVPRFNNI
jgi:hypothetical protein